MSFESDTPLDTIDKAYFGLMDDEHKVFATLRGGLDGFKASVCNSLSLKFKINS